MGKTKKKASIRKSIRIDGVLYRERFSTEEDAALWYADKLRQKRRVKAGLEEALEPNLLTIGEYAKVMMRKRVASGTVKGTWRNDGQRLEDYILPMVENRVLQSVKTDDWSKIFETIQLNPRKVAERRVIGATPELKVQIEKKLKKIKATPLSNTTRNKIRTLMHTFYEQAIEDKIVLHNPISKVEVLDEGDPEDKVDCWETGAEISKYLATHLEYGEEINNYSWYVWANWSLNKGPRINELTPLKHNDVDLEQRRIRISKIFDPYVGKIEDRTKGSRKSKSGGRKRSNRWMYLNDSMIEAYRLHLDITPYNKPDDFIFMNTRSEKYINVNKQSNKLTASGIWRVHIIICEMAGLRQIRIHDLRHTFASHYLMNGGSLESLADTLGHSNTYVTSRYGHLSESHMAKESDRVSFDPTSNRTRRDTGRDPKVIP